MSSKVEQVWATLEDFSPGRYQVNGKKQIPKKSQNHSTRHQISFGILLQMFSWHWITRKFSPKTWHLNGKNPFQATMQLNSPTQWNTKVVYPISFIYVWTTSEDQVQDFYASQKLQVNSSLRRPETDFRQRQVP